VIGGGADDQRIFAPDPGFQLRVIDRAFHAGNVAAMFQQLIDDVGRVVHGHMQGHARVLAHKLPHQIPNQIVADGIAGPDADFTTQLAFFLLALHLPQALQNFASVRQQLLAAAGQLHAPRRAFKQGTVQLLFQFGQGHAGGGLGQVNLGCASTHGAQGGNAYEHFQLSDADRIHDK